MSIQMDPPRSPLPAAAQVLAEAALQRQNMLLGADKGGSAAAGPIPSAPSPDTPLAPPPLPEGVSDPVQSDRVSLSPRASQALQAQGQGGIGQGNAASAAPRAAPLPPAAATLAAAAAGGAEAVQGAAWPAQGVSHAMRGLLQALVQQLAPAAPPRVVVAQPWGPAPGGGVSADADVPPLQTWLVGQGHVLTEQGERAFTATLRVPAAWLQAQPAAPAAAPPGCASALQAAFAGRPQALAGGLFALGNIAPLLAPRLNFGPEFVQLRAQTLGHTAPRKIKNPPHRHDDAQDAHHP